jgi:hypothetical protein
LHWHLQRTGWLGARDRAVCCLFVFLGLVSPLRAQQAPVTGLHRRTAASTSNSTAPATVVKSPSTLPSDASGDYLLSNEPGNVIQISLQRKELDGYVSTKGELESDRDAPLTLFFSHTMLDGPRLSFDTYQIHGIWFSFEGTIVRGSGTSKNDEGYYLLQGTLTKHNTAEKLSEPRKVNLRSGRQG